MIFKRKLYTFIMYIDNQTFSKVDYKTHLLEKWEYEWCTFFQCDFLKSDISHIRFSDCEFIGCDLSMVKMIETSLQNVRFNECKLLWTEWKNCNAFLLEVSFEHCNLELSMFWGMKLKNTLFRNSDLREANFAQSNLAAAIFENCNLERVLFQKTNLEKANLLTSYGYTLDPEDNKIQGAKFSLEWLPGLLVKYNICIQ